MDWTYYLQYLQLTGPVWGNVPINPLAQLLNLLHFAIQTQPTIFNFWHSGTLALSPERQSARMSEIKNGRLGLYGAEHSKRKRMTKLGFKGLSQESMHCAVKCWI